MDGCGELEQQHLAHVARALLLHLLVMGSACAHTHIGVVVRERARAGNRPPNWRRQVIPASLPPCPLLATARLPASLLPTSATTDVSNIPSRSTNSLKLLLPPPTPK